MLFLLFQLGQDRYAIDACSIIEVLPLVSIKPLPQAPSSVAGVFMYRGGLVPVIDVNQLTLGDPARRRLNTRIALVQVPDVEGHTRCVGLIIERATETLRRDTADFVESAVANDQAPYLGSVTTDARGLVQRIDVANLLPASLRRTHFKDSGPS